jgi:hypothetical protein
LTVFVVSSLVESRCPCRDVGEAILVGSLRPIRTARETLGGRTLERLLQARGMARGKWPRGVENDRTTGADQSVVRGGQDRRDQAGRGLSSAVRRRFHLGNANQPLRAGRQLSSRAQPRSCSVDPPSPRSQVSRRANRNHMGHRPTTGASLRPSAAAPIWDRCRRSPGRGRRSAGSCRMPRIWFLSASDMLSS